MGALEFLVRRDGDQGALGLEGLHGGSHLPSDNAQDAGCHTMVTVIVPVESTLTAPIS